MVFLQKQMFSIFFLARRAFNNVYEFVDALICLFVGFVYNNLINVSSK